MPVPPLLVRGPVTLSSRLRCAGCAHVLDAEDPAPFRCPAAVAGDDVDHVLEVALDLDGDAFPGEDAEHPFLRYRTLLHAYRFARRRGLSDGDWRAAVLELDEAVRAVDGVGFRETPLLRADELAGVPLRIKDETGNVAGSHKARHLFGVALFLEVAGNDSRPLAIASCGNAALAAAVVARAMDRPLEAFVPEAPNARVVSRLEELGARVVRCRREDGAPGDPCMHALRAAVAGGAVPFTVQGDANGLSLEGGRTLAWEVVSRLRAAGEPLPDNVVVQVGGGALGSSFVQGLEVARALGAIDALPRFFFVQPAGVQPLREAWLRLSADAHAALGTPFVGDDAPGVARWWTEHGADERVQAVRNGARRRRSRYLRPWPSPAPSIATGILDDETYDGFRLLDAMIDTGGWPLVVDEDELARACSLGGRLDGVDADATGTAGLAGVLRAHGALPEESWLALFTGTRQ